MAVIKLEQVSHIYNQGMPDEKVAIENINLEVQKGQVVGIIGHTGSGKSTLIQHLNALMKPTSGKIFINGENIWADPKNVSRFRFQVGLVFQYPEYQLFEETVFADIAFGPKNMKLSQQEVASRVREAAKFVGVGEEIFKKSPFELSGGQKRRVAIAGVLAMRPEILILDEPAAGLDPRGKQSIMSAIMEYKERTNATIMMISHSMDDIAAYTDYCLVLNEGEVYAFDTTKNIFARADELSSIGLNIPEISEIVLQLIQNGVDISRDLFTVEEVAQVLKTLLEGVK